MLSHAAYLIAAVHTAVDAPPEPADVKAGWTAFIIFLLLFAAVVALGFSMSRQFKKAARSREAGILPSAADPVPGRDGQPADRNSGTV